MNLLSLVPIPDAVREAWMEAVLYASIARQIKALRESRGMTQVEMARRLKTSQSAIARLEDPLRCRPRTNTLCEIAALFDVGLIIRFCAVSEFVISITEAGVYIKSYEEDMRERDAHLHAEGECK